MLDARTWLLWAFTVLIAASSARNPLYGLLLLGGTQAVRVLCAQSGGEGVRLGSLRLVVGVVLLAAGVNMLTVRVGDTVLLRLPKWLPLVGGPLTLEALAYGASNGLLLAAILTGFAAFNQIVPVRDLVRVAPRAFHETGVVLSIALTFLPQTLVSLRRIREAQALRGHRVRSVRDWLPIVLPLIVSGLERSTELAEAMVARGYGAVAERSQPWRLRVLVGCGMLALVAGWAAWLFGPVGNAWRGVPSWAAGAGLMVTGAGCIVGALWLAGQGVATTHYRARRWTSGDALAWAGCALALGVTLLPLPWLDRASLVYNPYPRLAWPSFDPVVGIGLLGLVIPAVAGKRRDDPVRPSDVHVS